MYAQSGSGDAVAITVDGNHLGNNSYDGWSMLGAENVGGVNQLMWGHRDGRFFLTDHTSSWEYSDGAIVSGSDFYAAEVSFNQDFNADGVTGNPITTIEAVGNIALLKDQEEKVYAQSGSGEAVAITVFGDHLGNNSYCLLYTSPRPRD